MAKPEWCRADGTIEEHAFSEGSRTDASVWETTRTSAPHALGLGGGNGRTQALLLDVGAIHGLIVEYQTKSCGPQRWSPEVIWSDAGAWIPVGAPGRDGHADIRPLRPLSDDVSGKAGDVARRYLRTRLTELARIEPGAGISRP